MGFSGARHLCPGGGLDAQIAEFIRLHAAGLREYGYRRHRQRDRNGGGIGCVFEYHFTPSDFRSGTEVSDVATVEAAVADVRTERVDRQRTAAAYEGP
ncbi:hypothetical protein [Nocardia brasiliensis]|uniref:hypothetical protein n=1 Tax=Nocardia brasiliensis TaxID=37326 RepID=UPI0018934F78|nr:hypothetical protein [Nocardia brasiliensis]MBF6542437.1 hypothetical protein [Nocardia brasiliensis]